MMILDNSTTAMTGHQDHACTGETLMGELIPSIDIKKMCEAMGIEHVYEISSFDLKGLTTLLKEETKRDALSVIICKSPCVLIKKDRINIIKNQYVVDPEKCIACGVCMKPGCPALTRDEDGKTKINDALCNGCGLCYRLCNFGAINMVDTALDRL